MDKITLSNFKDIDFESLNKERAEKYLEDGNGPLVGFELDGGIEAGKTFIDSLEFCQLSKGVTR